MAISLPMMLYGDPVRYTVTEDISMSGLAFMDSRPITVGEHIPITLVTPFGRLDTEIEVRNCQEVAAGRVYRVGAGLAEPSGISRQILTQLCETGR